MRIHKLLASEDASKKKAHGNTRSNGRGVKQRKRFSKIILEVGERKMRGEWQIM